MGSLSDDSGNRIMVDDNIITLVLKDGSRHKVGVINEKEKVMETIRKKDIHTLRKANAYGFNHYIVSKARRFNAIKLSDEEGSYKIPLDVILKWGFFLHFKTQGFERQIFLDKDIIKNYKIKSYV